MPYEGLARIGKNGARWTGEVRMVPEHLADPLRWRRPRRVFVNSMSDLFHEGLTNEQIAAVFGVMAAAPGHTFQVLTKRAKRMRDWFEWIDEQGRELMAQVNETPPGGSPIPAACAISANLASELEVISGDAWRAAMKAPWPLPNVHLGVSCEDQATADERIPALLQTPAAVRWISAEPLLGPVSLRPWLLTRGQSLDAAGLDWLVVGGESGPASRPMRAEWATSLRDQCQAAGVPYFFKQWGEHVEVVDYKPDKRGRVKFDGKLRPLVTVDGRQFIRMGKKDAGRMIDGVTHSEFPR